MGMIAFGGSLKHRTDGFKLAIYRYLRHCLHKVGPCRKIVCQVALPDSRAFRDLGPCKSRETMLTQQGNTCHDDLHSTVVFFSHVGRYTKQRVAYEYSNWKTRS